TISAPVRVSPVSASGGSLSSISASAKREKKVFVFQGGERQRLTAGTPGVKPEYTRMRWPIAGPEGGPFATMRRNHPGNGDPLATAKEMSDFLASVERRAFKQAIFAVQEEEAALDIVQDAMLKLAEKYSARPAAELPLLFQRILQNAIRDHFRRTKVRSTWTTLLHSMGLGGEDDEGDPLESLEEIG